MSAPAYQQAVIKHCTKRAKELLHGSGNLSRDDLEYLAKSVAKMKDQRLISCVAELMKWGDDERAELETMMAIGLEAMKLCSASRLREAATRVELRYHVRLAGIDG
jgi:hypothetical protein